MVRIGLLVFLAVVAVGQDVDEAITVSFSGPLTGLTWSDVLTDADTESLSGTALSDDMLLQTIKLEGIDQGNVAIKLESPALEKMGAVPKSADGKPRTSAYIVINALEFQYRVAPRPILERVSGLSSARTSDKEIELKLTFTEHVTFEVPTTCEGKQGAEMAACGNRRTCTDQLCLARNSLRTNDVTVFDVTTFKQMPTSEMMAPVFHFKIKPKSPNSEQNLEISVDADVAKNKQKISNEMQTFKVLFDPVRPVPRLIAAELNGVSRVAGEEWQEKSSPITITVSFDEEIVSSQFDKSDFVATNGKDNYPVEDPQKIVGDSTCLNCFTVAITPIKTGPFTLQMKAEAVRDMANNPSEASIVQKFVYDPPRPTLTILSNVNLDTAQAKIPFTFYFDHKMSLTRFNENIKTNLVSIRNGKIEGVGRDVTVGSKQNSESQFTVDVTVSYSPGSPFTNSVTKSFPVEVSGLAALTVQAGTEIGNEASKQPASVIYNPCLKCSHVVVNGQIRMQAQCTPRDFPTSPVCVCLPGFFGDGTTCVPCPGFDGTSATKPCLGNGRCLACDSNEGQTIGASACATKKTAYSSFCDCDKNEENKPKWGGMECKINLLTSPVEDFQATIISFSEVLLTWKAPQGQNKDFPITEYDISYSKVGDTVQKTSMKVSSPDVIKSPLPTSYKVTGLTAADKPYQFDIVSKNGVGVSNAITAEVLLSPRMDNITWTAAAGKGDRVKGDTRGGDLVEITGENFIPDAQDADENVRKSQVEILIGPATTRQLRCAVQSVTNTLIKCIMDPGAGAQLTVTLRNVGNSANPVTAVSSVEGGLTYSYVKPYIMPETLRLKKNEDSVGTGNVTGNYPQSDELVFEGYGFGDSSKEPTKILIRYGQSEPFFECRVNDDKEGETPQIYHTKAYCKTSYGSGAQLPFQIEVAGQKSDWSFDTFSYAETPKILSVQGCTPDTSGKPGQRTIDCDTRGFTDLKGEQIPVKITIVGERFGDEQNDLNVFIRGEICTDPRLNPDGVDPPNNNKLTCTLPRGTGSRVPVMVSRHQFLSSPEAFLSYGIPKVRGITGCSKLDKVPETYATETTPVADNGAAKDCPREMKVRITITGENFGYQNAEVYVAGEECKNVVHNSADPHRQLSCDLPSPQDTGAERTVVVIQENGESSRKNSGKLAYEKCPTGEFHNPEREFHCSPCVPGKYTSSAGLTICNDCAKGTFNDVFRGTNCTSCQVKFHQPEEGKTNCVACDAGKYASNVGAWQCQQCDAGTYVHMQTCKKCPAFGVKCESGKAQAKKDYFVYPDQAAITKYGIEYSDPDYFPEYEGVRCPSNYCDADECAPNREGIMCGTCREGFYPSGSKCFPCKFSDDALLIVPFILNWVLVLFIFMTSRHDGSAYDGITKIFLFFVQTTFLFFTINKLGTDFAAFLAFFTFNSLAYLNFNVNDIGEGMCFQSTALLNLNTGIIQPLVSVFQLLCMLVGHFILHKLKSRRNEEFVPFNTGPYRRAFVALFLFVFYNLTSSCVSILACQDVVYRGTISAEVSAKLHPNPPYPIVDYLGVPGHRLQDTVVVAAPSVSCLEYPYDYLKAVAITIEALKALFVLGSLVFILIGYKAGHFKAWKDDQVDQLDDQINQHSFDPESPDYKKAIDAKIDLETFYNNWSGVFRGYDYKYFYWEYIMSARRYSVIFIVSFLHESYDRYFGLSLVCIGSLVLHVISYPFAVPSVDRADKLMIHPGMWAWNILSAVNHLETMSLSVLALLVQLMLSEDPERNEIIITKVTLILFTIIVLGFSLVYVVFMEKIGYKYCSKYVENATDDKPVAAVEEDQDKEGPTMDAPVVDDDLIPEAVDEEGDKDKGKGDDDSEDPYAVHKPPKDTGDGETGEDDTGGDTLETDGVDGTGDTSTDADGVEDTEDTLDKDLDAALVASAATAATKKKGSANDQNPDLDEALRQGAEEAARQAANENIE